MIAPTIKIGDNIKKTMVCIAMNGAEINDGIPTISRNNNAAVMMNKNTNALDTVFLIAIVTPPYSYYVFLVINLIPFSSRFLF